MSSQELTPLRDRFYVFEEQEVSVHDFQSDGYILDIGGGGEGIIGILKGERVIAIDTRKSELAGAADGPLKIVMDARDMIFMDNSFNTVTAFFTLMYLKNETDYERVFSEVHRVLKPGGLFLIWDVNVPLRPEGEKRNYLLPVRVIVKDRLIETGYAQPWPMKEHDMAYYLDLAEKSGFCFIKGIENGQTFLLQVEKR